MTKRADKIAFIGGGNMAEALARGLLSAGTTAADIRIAEPLAKRRAYWKKAYRISATDSNLDAARDATIVVVAVKPQIIDSVLAELAQAIDRHKLVVSIAAGVPLARLERPLGVRPRVVRVMPNTPCLVGRGASVLVAGGGATKADARRARTLFAHVGNAYVVDDEKVLDAVTGLSGSGPAYVYLFAEALIRGARAEGLDDDLAARLTYETLAGAAEMLLRTGRSPEELRAAVTSPGGTTLAGLNRLADGEFTKTVTAAVRAATRRSRQLGRQRR